MSRAPMRIEYTPAASGPILNFPLLSAKSIGETPASTRDTSTCAALIGFCWESKTCPTIVQSPFSSASIVIVSSSRPGFTFSRRFSPPRSPARTVTRWGTSLQLSTEKRPLSSVNVIPPESFMLVTPSEGKASTGAPLIPFPWESTTRPQILSPTLRTMSWRTLAPGFPRIVNAVFPTLSLLTRREISSAGSPASA